MGVGQEFYTHVRFVWHSHDNLLLPHRLRSVAGFQGIS